MPTLKNFLLIHQDKKLYPFQRQKLWKLFVITTEKNKRFEISFNNTNSTNKEMIDFFETRAEK